VTLGAGIGEFASELLEDYQKPEDLFGAGWLAQTIAKAAGGEGNVQS